MKREIKITGDGSKTLFISEMNESYHSTHGALQEAVYVFIKNGINLVKKEEIHILEMGFGTGLNLLVTIDNYIKNQSQNTIRYFTIEKYPVLVSEIEKLDYPHLFGFENVKEIYNKAHQADWGEEIELFPNFYFTKFNTDFFDIPELSIPKIDLVYYDCFGARVQPDLWEKPLFELVTERMGEGALLTTYSSKGSVRRALKELGLEVEKKDGPPGKREMINAWKRKGD
ncbi:tRNA (5-methylaminomethyl-2-thiouridine)(34)-methyltransferase MnmD [Bergeyella cardium]|uniref:tRNA (5-methylaminomethyl-2-thiouridine)(34)-methyltransferase MnmD n=1 Tax=Bergeyella cardium TaxID=1585976 RepID=A0A6P1QYQ3_9FLAO|nr:tRNA (5-methylaminomethyl-2-thiouridine)(34)-methyltransferase MnmD [Bergeyella cardium]QHN65814.1 tRNA (5-methylaminomethyl-2-thiouridine)(34)-methyltransferase MnmD [Bergeyella cardium]WHE33413.1 tRNA (5-methylaminomethyl-2-thiouridine)(34)-methyltransferase MnmD [Bergeyella cardium]WHF60063.1 tRNA (5-methylaminomethyl-2-thiouridine)(34)-methyltransferase MnmD [Bergeyella cardium]